MALLSGKPSRPPPISYWSSADISKFRDTFRNITTPSKVERLLGMFQNTMWPGGVRRPETPPRTDAERLDARVISSRRLGMLIPDVAANIIGRGNSRRAANLVWGSLQDRRLNQHFVLCVFDEVSCARWGEGDENAPEKGDGERY